MLCDNRILGTSGQCPYILHRCILLQHFTCGKNPHQRQFVMLLNSPQNIGLVFISRKIHYNIFNFKTTPIPKHRVFLEFGIISCHSQLLLFVVFLVYPVWTWVQNKEIKYWNMEH